MQTAPAPFECEHDDSFESLYRCVFHGFLIY